MEELFTIQEISEKLKLSCSTLYRYAETGKLQHNKIGRKIRFTNSQIQDFLSKNLNEKQEVLKPQTKQAAIITGDKNE